MHVFGLSSGALIALQYTALAGAALHKAALYEPPLSINHSTPTACGNHAPVLEVRLARPPLRGSGRQAGVVACSDAAAAGADAATVAAAGPASLGRMSATITDASAVHDSAQNNSSHR